MWYNIIIKEHITLSQWSRLIHSLLCLLLTGYGPFTWHLTWQEWWLFTYQRQRPLCLALLSRNLGAHSNVWELWSSLWSIPFSLRGWTAWAPTYLHLWMDLQQWETQCLTIHGWAVLCQKIKNVAVIGESMYSRLSNPPSQPQKTPEPWEV